MCIGVIRFNFYNSLRSFLRIIIILISIYVADIHTKLVTCANQMPVFGEMDSAGNKSVTDRMVVLRFNHTIPEEQMDRELPDKLLNECDMICSLAMKALNGLISRGYIFTLPDDSKKLIDSYIQESWIALSNPSTMPRSICPAYAIRWTHYFPARR